jgi:hypothetical protein
VSDSAKRYLKENGLMGFDDSHRPVPVVWTEHGDAIENLLMDALEDVGAIFPDRDIASEIIAEAIDLHGDRRAADALGQIFANLPGGKAGTQLKQALLGACGEGSEAAKTFGVNEQNWFRSIQRLRARILKRTSEPT